MKNQEFKPLVTILINCYNSSNFISRAINSVINQSYQNWELIIWDDGSTDNTADVIESFKDNRIKLFSQKKNRGLCYGRINAAKNINGSLVSILDSDDFFDHEKILKQVNIFKQNKNVVLCSTWSNLLDENLLIKKKFESNLSNKELKKRLMFVNFFPHSSIMYKKAAALNVGWYSKNFEYSQDYDLTLKLLKKNEVYLIRENLTNIVQHQKTMSNSENFEKIRILEYLKILSNNVKTLSVTKSEINIFENLIQLNLIKLALNGMKKNFTSSLKELIKIFCKNPFILLKFNLIKNLNEIKKI